MDWNLRYANSKIPSKCIFCNGPNHLLKNAVDNSKKGLPRPLIENSEQGRASGVPGTRFPLPWSVSPKDPDKEFSIDNISFQEKQIPVVTENLCPLCGEGFDPGEPAARAKGTQHFNNLYISNAPFHTKCMQITRRFCPIMREAPEENFEYGTAKKLIERTKRDNSWRTRPHWLPKDENEYE